MIHFGANALTGNIVAVSLATVIAVLILLKACMDFREDKSDGYNAGLYQVFSIAGGISAIFLLLDPAQLKPADYDHALVITVFWLFWLFVSMSMLAHHHRLGELFASAFVAGVGLTVLVKFWEYSSDPTREQRLQLHQLNLVLLAMDGILLIVALVAVVYMTIDLLAAAHRTGTPSQRPTGRDS